MAVGHFGLLLACLVVSCFRCVEGINAQDERPDESLERWQQCNVFLAPSGWRNGGFGVFAARPFRKNEIVEIAPLFVPLDLQEPVIVNSALRDYIYGYLRMDGSGDERHSVQELGVVVTGNTMFVNHHPTHPNLGFGNFGIEPEGPDAQVAQSVGLVAARDIEAGEELFSKYGSDDVGQQWFLDRGLPLMDIPPEGLRMEQADLSISSEQFCSNIYAGIGLPTWRDRVVPTHDADGVRFTFDLDQLAPFDVGLHDAVVKVNVLQGEIVEIAPALVLAKEKVDGTALAPLVFLWEELHARHQVLLRHFRSIGDLVMQHQGDDNNWERKDRWVGLDQVALFAASGHIASVRRVGNDGPNCRLEIMSSGMEDGNAGIILQLVATQNILAGDMLKLDLSPSSASSEEKSLLWDELIRTGQPSSSVNQTTNGATVGTESGLLDEF